MKQQDDDQEMSMEEILASIRKYVTDDGSAPSQGAASGSNSHTQVPQESHSSQHDDHHHSHDEDVLDLKNIHSMTEHLPDPGQYAPTQPALSQSAFQATSSHAPQPPMPAPEVPQAQSYQPTSHAQQPYAAPTSSYPTYTAPAANPQQSQPAVPSQQPYSPKLQQGPAAPIASGQTMTSSAMALSRLVDVARTAGESHDQPSAVYSDAKRSEFASVTLEQVAHQAIIPLLRQWMDTNLPSLVERLVQKEIENITAELLKKK